MYKILLQSKLISGSTMHDEHLWKGAESLCVTCEKPGEEVPEGGEVCGRMRPAHQQHQALAHRRTIYTPKSVLIPGGGDPFFLLNGLGIFSFKLFLPAGAQLFLVLLSPLIAFSCCQVAVSHTMLTAKRCRLSWLTNSALVYEPKYGGAGGFCQWLQPFTRSPNKLWRSTSIFNFWLIPFHGTHFCSELRVGYVFMSIRVRMDFLF